jgi:adenine-specific DNA-methyltransferase
VTRSGDTLLQKSVGPSPIRYMGTKRPIAHRVRRIVDDLHPMGSVVDLFSGMGSVASCLAPAYPIVANDNLSFTGSFARARFEIQRRTPVAELLPGMRSVFRAQLRWLTSRYSGRLGWEAAAMNSGWIALGEFMSRAPHVGNSAHYARSAHASQVSVGPARYSLVTLYFSGGYFSTRQAVAIDSLRRAIDLSPPHNHDWLLSAWLATVGTVMNAPGHAAQYLKCHDVRSYERVRRAWRRDVWSVFINKLWEVGAIGTATWRRKNIVRTSDALSLLQGGLRRVGLIYADPPYTRDQYSRFYHLYETLYLYDFPRSTGSGRYREGRFSTDFSLALRVERAFVELLEAARQYSVPVILSYPDDGLLVRATGVNVRRLLGRHFQSVSVERFAMQHSTMGASKGVSRKHAMENIYVCLPSR